MEKLLKEYAEVRLQLYLKKGFEQHQAVIAAKYAVEDMVNELKANAKGCEKEYLREENEYLKRHLEKLEVVQ